MQKNILITNFEMRQFTGSEINAATIAKRFKELGYKVYMLAMYFGEPLYNQVKDNFDEIIDITKNEFDFEKIEFDLVWVHHSFLLNWLIFDNKIKAKKIIVSSLSGVVLFEYIPKYANDLSLVLANSQETKEQLLKEGIKEVHLLENYSFKSYFEQENTVKKLKNIAIVSNHIPDEVMEAKKMLEEKEYNVEIYGLAGKQELIDDKILRKYDAIITIGKTVQYAMSLGIPVYVYDIHGGEGYLTLENIEKNRSKNFSGRGFSKKTAEEIFNEITQNFEENLKIVKKIKQYAYENFCFEDNIDKILEIIEQKESVDLDKIRAEYKNNIREVLNTKGMATYLIEKYEDILRIERHELYTEIRRLTESEENLRNAVIDKDKLIKEQENIINEKDKTIGKINNTIFGRCIKVLNKVKHRKEKGK